MVFVDNKINLKCHHTYLLRSQTVYMRARSLTDESKPAVDCFQYLVLDIVLKLCSDLNRLCSLPPAAQLRPPRGATSRSDRGGGAGSDSFQSDHHSAQSGRCHGKLHQHSKPGLSGRHSQRHRHAEMESRIRQPGLHRGRGSASDRAAAGERGADGVALGGAGRDLRGGRGGGGFRSGAMLLPV